MLLAPAVVVLVLVSLHPSVPHFRYLLPAFPFLFVAISRVGRVFEQYGYGKQALVGLALVASIASSLWVYPHSLSFFNLAAGGPRNGHYHLIDSAIDWGQDLFYLKAWHDQHPEAQPLHVEVDSIGNAEGILGFNNQSIPQYPQPGWFALSVDRLHRRDWRYRYFLEHFQPVAMAGYSISIYHITPEEANRVRRELGHANAGSFCYRYPGFRIWRQAGPIPASRCIIILTDSCHLE